MGRIPRAGKCAGTANAAMLRWDFFVINESQVAKLLSGGTCRSWLEFVSQVMLHKAAEILLTKWTEAPTRLAETWSGKSLRCRFWAWDDMPQWSTGADPFLHTKRRKLFVTNQSPQYDSWPVMKPIGGNLSYIAKFHGDTVTSSVLAHWKRVKLPSPNDF